jgi:hypothetical protein
MAAVCISGKHRQPDRLARGPRDAFRGWAAPKWHWILRVLEFVNRISRRFRSLTFLGIYHCRDFAPAHLGLQQVGQGSIDPSNSFMKISQRSLVLVDSWSGSSMACDCDSSVLSTITQDCKLRAQHAAYTVCPLAPPKTGKSHVGHTDGSQGINRVVAVPYRPRLICVYILTASVWLNVYLPSS